MQLILCVGESSEQNTLANQKLNELLSLVTYIIHTISNE